MVVLGRHDEVELITPPARTLLASLHPGESGYTDETIATPVLALASFIRSTPDGGQGTGNVVTVPSRDGWVTLHASLPGAPDDGRIAVVLERSTGARSATIRLEAIGATPREREVATLLARGLSRAEMAETLVVSPHTVEDHVKNLYEKLGVASRQELVARVFVDEYLPEVVRRTPLTSRGRFDLE
jgi:DNA-binding CsgD family transcriptional regulator